MKLLPGKSVTGSKVDPPEGVELWGAMNEVCVGGGVLGGEGGA